jgi:O-antigen/teichoic acid export membrane protein
MKKLLFKSSTFRFIEISTEILISIILTPFLIHNLGDSHYGLWILILSTLGWFKFAEFGFPDAIQRSIILAIENNNNQRVNTLYSVSIILFGSLGLIAALLVLVLALLPEMLGIHPKDLHTASIILSILALKVFWDFIMNCFHGFFMAYLRMDIDANLSSLNSIIRSLLIFYLILDLNIYGAVLATMVADIITYSFKIYYVKKLDSNFKFNLKLVKLSEIKELFSFSKHIIISSLTLNMNGRIDPIIITHLFGLKLVALYSVTSRLVIQIEGLVNAIVGVFLPVFTKLVARNENINTIFNQIISLNFFIVILFYTPLAILAENFITLWIGKDYASAAELAFILGFAFMCRTISRPIKDVLLAQAQHKLISLIHLIGITLNIVLSIFLASLWGLKGIAIATAISFFLSDVILYLLMYKHYNKIQIFPLFLKFICMCVSYIILVNIGKLILSLIPPLSWGGLILAGGLCEITIALFTWVFILKKDTRQKIITHFQERNN